MDHDNRGNAVNSLGRGTGRKFNMSAIKREFHASVWETAHDQ
jgi:hypothetical protein